jgi:hypothetical protein
MLQTFLGEFLELESQKHQRTFLVYLCKKVKRAIADFSRKKEKAFTIRKDV